MGFGNSGKYLIHYFDGNKWTKKDKWITDKKLKELMNKEDKIPTKKGITNFLSFKKKYITNTFDFGKDIQLIPLRKTEFGYYKKI